ncbi:hypothetical protein K2Z84_24680, partial [Candidatus Binatia bacterium]|nr:hypothetical protein [Candidatus Binatia bacterium]
RLETLCRERGMGFVALRTGDDAATLLRGGVQRTLPRTAATSRKAGATEPARRAVAGGAR